MSAASLELGHLFVHISLQTLAETIEHPFCFALIGHHGAIVADPIPLDDALVLFLLVKLVRNRVLARFLVFGKADQARKFDPFLVVVAAEVTVFEIVSRVADGSCEAVGQIVLIERFLFSELLEGSAITAFLLLLLLLLIGANGEALLEATLLLFDFYPT